MTGIGRCGTLLNDGCWPRRVFGERSVRRHDGLQPRDRRWDGPLGRSGNCRLVSEGCEFKSCPAYQCTPVLRSGRECEDHLQLTCFRRPTSASQATDRGRDASTLHRSGADALHRDPSRPRPSRPSRTPPMAPGTMYDRSSGRLRVRNRTNQYGCRERTH
jgi:hypothetical protein